MKRIIICALLIVSALSLSAQQVRGEIIYLDGDVNVSRRGELLPVYEVDMGLSVEEEDIIRTGSNGYIEIELAYPQQGSLLKIQPNTAFYFETKVESGKSKTRISLLNGTIGLKVSKLTSNQSMDVETQSAVMGIRGTEFDVNRAPTGELLVTCWEGKVSCATPAMESFSQPGIISLQEDGKDFSNANIPVEELDAYREKWWTARLEALVSMGPISSEYYYNRYKTQSALFNEAFENVEDEDRLFREYEKMMDEGVEPTMSKATQDKITLTSPVIEMRSILPVMEEIFYTLLVLEEYHSNGSFNLADRKYFKDFNKEKDDLERDIILARYYLTLYGKISRFSAGGNSMMSDMLENSPF